MHDFTSGFGKVSFLEADVRRPGSDRDVACPKGVTQVNSKESIQERVAGVRGHCRRDAAISKLHMCLHRVVIWSLLLSPTGQLDPGPHQLSWCTLLQGRSPADSERAGNVAMVLPWKTGCQKGILVGNGWGKSPPQPQGVQGREDEKLCASLSHGALC